MKLKWFYILCAFTGFIGPLLPECILFWGYPILLMSVAGALTRLVTGSRPSGKLSPPIAAALAGAIIGICFSHSAVLNAFLGGSTDVSRPEVPTVVLFVPNLIMGILGGLYGLMGLAFAALVRWSLSRIRRPK
jgi:hypothetical protein